MDTQLAPLFSKETWIAHSIESIQGTHIPANSVWDRACDQGSTSYLTFRPERGSLITHQNGLLKADSKGWLQSFA